MAHIQMSDNNPSDLGIMEEVEELTSEEVLDEELTDEELSAIDGGGIGAIGGAVSSILGSVSNRKPIDWGSAGSGAVQGAIAGSSGGLWGASLAGSD